MITVNSTILSYNKINQVQEQIPLELPDSYIFEEKKSAQKLIPDLYDLDRLEDENFFLKRNSTPILSSKNDIRNNYFNSVLNDPSMIKIKRNIYSNFDDIGIESLKESGDLKYNLTEDKKEEEINNINKINDNIININKTYNKISNNNIKASQQNLYGEKSIQSEFKVFNFKNIMKKDTKNNIVTINTSLYKPRKRRSSLLSVSNPIIDKNNNNINDLLKFEEKSNKDKNSLDSFNGKNAIVINNKKKIKEEILKSFRNSNDIFNLSNYSHLEQGKNSNFVLNDKISDGISFLNVEENDNFNKNNNVNENLLGGVPRKITKKNSLNGCGFRTERNSGQRNSQQNINDLKRFSSMSSRRYNFDCPKKIISEECSKDHDDVQPNNNFKHKSKNNKHLNLFIPLVEINFKNLKKITKTGGLFNVLTFLDDNDLISILQSNKSLIALINKSIASAYFLRIKKDLKQYKNIFELIKCSLIYTKIKDSFKIDFVINIRFVNPNHFYSNIKLENLTPKCYQLLFFYQCYKALDPNAKLKTKENTKKIKMYDYYTFDLYPNEFRFPSIYITKESQQSNEKNINDKLVYIQPILPFKYNDKGIINLEIYSIKNNFISPSSIRIFMKKFDLKNYISELNLRQYNNLRICEYEDISTHWKSLDNEKNTNLSKEIKNKLKTRFEPNFFIENISYVNIGFVLYKINLEARKPGLLDRNIIGNDFGLDLCVKRKNEYIENEIKKNNLIIENRQIFEMRVDDKIIIYISAKKYKSGRKK